MSMNNKVYYVKPDNGNFAQAIKTAFVKAMALAITKKKFNIKLVVSSLAALDEEGAFKDGLDLLFNNSGGPIVKQLKKDRQFSIPNFPGKGDAFGINVLLVNKKPMLRDNEATVLLVWSQEDEFCQIESEIFFSSGDLIGVVWNETDALNDMLSATLASNISAIADPNVIPFVNTFPINVNAILSRLVGINITDTASHSPTQERMKKVINELKKDKIVINYRDFLGYLINIVNFPLDESIKLLDWQYRYFGQ